MELVFWFWLLAVGFAAFPIGYAVLSFWMMRRQVWWFTYCAYFFVFGSFGGWCLAIAAALMGPGIGALSALGMEAFLLTAAMTACLISSLVLQFRRKRNAFDRGAMFGGYAYVFLHSAFLSWIVYSAVTSPYA